MSRGDLVEVLLVDDEQHVLDGLPREAGMAYMSAWRWAVASRV